jgi:hypothetical protein
MASRKVAQQTPSVQKVVPGVARTTHSESGPRSARTTTPEMHHTLDRDHLQDHVGPLSEPGPEMGPISDRTIRKADRR